MNIARDLHNQIECRRMISPIAQTNVNTAMVSQIIDMQGFDGLEIIILIGGLTDANVTFTVLLEHGEVSNLSDAATVPAAQLLGTVTTAGFRFDDDDEVRKLGYRAATGKRYVRLTITPAGNDAGVTTIGAVGVLFNSNRQPTITQADD